MTFSINSNDLLKSLSNVSGVIAPNPVLPILDSILFEVKGGELKLSATNLETSSQTQIALLSSDGDMKVAIPAKMMIDTLKAIASQPISITVNETFGITIKTVRGKYSLTGENGSDYPRIAEVDEATAFTLPVAVLNKAIKATIFAPANDELRPSISNLLFKVEPNLLTLVGTNAHKLSKYEAAVQTSQNIAVIAPKKAMSFLSKIIDGETVKVYIDDTNISFRFGKSLVICRRVDANYPDYNAVLPTGNNKFLKISSTALLGAIQRIGLYANKTTNQVVMSLESGQGVKISAQDLDFANEAEEVIECESYEGDALTIGFNAGYLKEIISHINSESIVLSFDTASRPIVILPETQKDGENIYMMCMPVMLSN